jgi:hypothetical protein
MESKKEEVEQDCFPLKELQGRKFVNVIYDMETQVFILNCSDLIVKRTRMTSLLFVSF